MLTNGGFNLRIYEVLFQRYAAFMLHLYSHLVTSGSISVPFGSIPVPVGSIPVPFGSIPVPLWFRFGCIPFPC